jgi:hypothetical protein
MSKPTPPPDGDSDIPIGRLAVWAVLAAILAFGIYLYFRHAGDVGPVV